MSDYPHEGFRSPPFLEDEYMNSDLSPFTSRGRRPLPPPVPDLRQRQSNPPHPTPMDIVSSFVCLEGADIVPILEFSSPQQAADFQQACPIARSPSPQHRKWVRLQVPTGLSRVSAESGTPGTMSYHFISNQAAQDFLLNIWNTGIILQRKPRVVRVGVAL